MAARKVNAVLVSARVRTCPVRAHRCRSGLQFGPDVTERFLAFNNLDYVVRSHEVKQEGYELAHNGRRRASVIQGDVTLLLLNSRKMHHRLLGTELLRHDGKQRCFHYDLGRRRSAEVYILRRRLSSSRAPDDVRQSIVNVWFDVEGLREQTSDLKNA